MVLPINQKPQSIYVFIIPFKDVFSCSFSYFLLRLLSFILLKALSPTGWQMLFILYTLMGTISNSSYFSYFLSIYFSYSFRLGILKMKGKIPIKCNAKIIVYFSSLYYFPQSHVNAGWKRPAGSSARTPAELSPTLDQNSHGVIQLNVENL